MKIKVVYQKHKLPINFLFVLSIPILIINCKYFINNNVLKQIILLFLELMAFMSLNIIFRIVKNRIALEYKNYIVLIFVGTIALSILEIFLMLDEILEINNYSFIFCVHLIMQHYFLIISLREFIKLSRNEFYRHLIDTILYSLILAIDILSIGAYALKSTNTYIERLTIKSQEVGKKKFPYR